MKIWSITSVSLNQNKYGYHNDFESQRNRLATKLPVNNLNCMPVYYPVTFNGIQNSSKLRILFAYKLPCIYSGVPMIDPKQLGRWMKTGFFYRPATEVLDVLTPYKKNFTNPESKVIEILEKIAPLHSKKNIKEILEEVKPIYRRRLRKKQNPVFKELIKLSHKLPDKYRYKVKAFMKDTNNKLDEKPVIVPFSSYEFRYKLNKIKENINEGQDNKAKKVMNKLIKEAKNLSDVTSGSSLQQQKRVINFLDVILKKSVLKNNEQLKNLILTANSRLNQEKIIVPFSRKAFIYDLVKLIEDLPDKRLREEIFYTAQKLPTSQNSSSAYIMKLLTEPADKMGYRIIWPYLASVEHLNPRSCGGADAMYNFAGATTRENSKRKSIDFVAQIKLCPNTPKYCQQYVDRLIELYHLGIFDKYNINPKYIPDFKNTIYKLSRGKINLDISGMSKA